MKLTAARLMDLLSLQPHPTCGFVHETYHSPLRAPAAALPPGYGGPRPLGGALCFLVTPQAPVRLHRIRSDQMYHHYLGDPLDVLLLYPDGRGEVRVVGPDLTAGMRPFVLVPGGAFHAARLPRGGDYALLGNSVWVRPEPADVEMGDPERLMTAYPSLKEEVRAFAGR
jgi:predicted cupin superfamily sugar epimerase